MNDNKLKNRIGGGKVLICSNLPRDINMLT